MKVPPHRLVMKVRKVDEELGDRLGVAVRDGNVVLAEMVAEELALRLLSEERLVDVEPGWCLCYQLEPTNLALRQAGKKVIELGGCERLEDALRLIRAVLVAGQP